MSYLDSGNMTSDNSQGGMTNENNLEAFDLQLNKPANQYNNYSNLQLKNWRNE
jgi:hypothetical protein